MTEYRIKTVSKITNIPIDTIRNWEKRYDFLKPHVGHNGERFYSDDDVSLLRKISALLKTGGRISEIAFKILNGHDLEVIENKVSNEVKLMIEDYYQFLKDADLQKLDQIESLLEITVIFKNRIDYIYAPILERVRDESARGIISSVQEYFTTGHIINKLKGFLSTSIFKHNVEDCPVVCASPSNAVYEGGLLALACSLKLTGHNIYYLGSNVPLENLSTFVQEVQPAVLALSIHDPIELDPILDLFKNSEYPVCIGGNGVRLADCKEGIIGSVHLISYTGVSAVQKLEAICVSYHQEFKKKL